jgi:DNA-binding response OmpR family regulator/predicted negative regulator of RcsB-dependent stress response
MFTAQDINFSDLTVLVIDDHPGMRTSLRITLSNFGVTKTDMSQGAFDAVHRIKQRAYDVIICDYNLGEGRDGQQLLEELRHGKLISLSTVFLMVTAERTYEKVMSAVELAPDDYLIKPFTAEALQMRLGQVLKKKAAFAPVYRLMEADQLADAAAVCDRVASVAPAYSVDAWRLKAELLLAVGRIEEARKIYERILALRAVPWARLGLAKAMFMQEQQAEAEHILLDLVDEAPDYMAAQDFLARVQEAREDSTGALETLARAVERSPNVLGRQRVFGDVAWSLGEVEMAERAYSTVVAKGIHSILRSPEDHARLARVQVEQGKLQEAGATLKELRQHFPNDPGAGFAAYVVESLKESRSGNPESAQKLLDQAFQLQAEHDVKPSENLSLDLAQACIAGGKAEEGMAMMQSLVDNNHDNPRLLAKSRRVFSNLDMADRGEQLIKDSVKAAVALNNEAVMRARAGNLAEAAAMLRDAAERLPNNVQILLNAAHAQLSLITREGWDVKVANFAEHCIAQARQRNPDHPKLIKVEAMWRDLAKKYGVTRA